MRKSRRNETKFNAGEIHSEQCNANESKNRRIQKEN